MDLEFRPLRDADFKIYRRLVNDPKIARAARFQPAKSVGAAKKLFRDDLQNTTSYAVTLNDGMIGMLSLYATVGKAGAPDYSCLELAYMMLPNFQGRGYMTVAVRQLIERLRDDHHVKKLVALVDEANLASRKVLTGNHFKNYQSILDMVSGGEDLLYQLELTSR